MTNFDVKFFLNRNKGIKTKQTRYFFKTGVDNKEKQRSVF